MVPNRLTEAIIIFDGARKESKNEMYINIYFITITFARSYLYFDHHFDVAKKESKSEIYESVSTPLWLDHHFISHLRPEKLILSYGDMTRKICTSGWAHMAERTRATH